MRRSIFSRKFRQRRAKLSTIEATCPATGAAVKRHLIVKASRAGFASRAVHRVDIPAIGFSFEKCAPVLRVLLRRPIARKLTFKLFNAFRLIGYRCLGLFVGFLGQAQLILNERDAIPKDFRGLDAGNCGNAPSDCGKNTRHRNPPVVDEGCVRASDSTTCGDQGDGGGHD